MKKTLSRLANYARDRNITFLFIGSEGNIVRFNVREIASDRVRKFFERLLHEDNPRCDVDIKYIARGKSLRP